MAYRMEAWMYSTARAWEEKAMSSSQGSAGI